MAQKQGRYSEEQWKEFKFKLTLFIVVVVVGGAAAAIGPGLEPLFLKRAREKKTEAWAPRWMYNIARIEEATFRLPRAKELYEQEIYWLYRGNEAQYEPLAAMIETEYADNDDPDRYRYFLPWLVWPYLDSSTEEGRKQPDWVGGEFAKPNPIMGRVLNRVAKIYEEKRDYIPMRHVHKVMKYSFKEDAEAWAEGEEARLRDSTRSY